MKVKIVSSVEGEKDLEEKINGELMKIESDGIEAGIQIEHEIKDVRFFPLWVGENEFNSGYVLYATILYE